MQPKLLVVHRIQGQQFSWQDAFQKSQEITFTSNIHGIHHIESHLKITRLLRVPESANNTNLGIQLFTCTKGIFENIDNEELEQLQHFAKNEAINIMWPFAIEKFRSIANSLVTQEFHIEFSFEEKFPPDVVKYKIDSGDIRVSQIDPPSLTPSPK